MKRWSFVLFTECDGHACQIVQFTSTKDLWVAGGYLFNQSGARSWHADDENGIRCFAPPLFVGVKTLE